MKPKALVECLDGVTFESLSNAALPEYEGRLQLTVRYVSPTSPVSSAHVTFVVASGDAVLAVAGRGDCYGERGSLCSARWRATRKSASQVLMV